MRFKAAEIPAPTDSGLPIPQKCMKNNRGCSVSMWLVGGGCKQLPFFGERQDVWEATHLAFRLALYTPRQISALFGGQSV
jgi:hypothetical protein